MTKRYGDYEQVNGAVANDLLAQIKELQGRLDSSRAESIRWADRMDNVNAELLTKDAKLTMARDALKSILTHKPPKGSSWHPYHGVLQIAREALNIANEVSGICERKPSTKNHLPPESSGVYALGIYGPTSSGDLFFGKHKGSEEVSNRIKPKRVWMDDSGVIFVEVESKNKAQLKEAE